MTIVTDRKQLDSHHDAVSARVFVTESIAASGVGAHTGTVNLPPLRAATHA